MARPYGYIDITDGGWPVEDTEMVDYAWIPIDLLLLEQHPCWRETLMRPRQYIELYAQITVPAGSTLTLSPGIWETYAFNDNFAGAIAGAWNEIDTGDIMPSPSAINTYTSAWGLLAEKPSHAPNDIYGETDADECQVLMLCLDTQHAKLYDESTPEGDGDVEHCGRTTGASTWRPYEENEPVSAWLMKRVIAQSYNYLLYQSRQVWSVPL